MKTVIVIERSYDRVLSYEKNEDDGNLRRSDVRIARIERSGPYVIPDEIKITMN